MQPIKELLSAAGLCAGKGCVLIKQLANYLLLCCILSLNSISGFWCCSKIVKVSLNNSVQNKRTVRNKVDMCAVRCFCSSVLGILTGKDVSL